MPRTSTPRAVEARIMSATRGRPVNRRPRPLPGQKQFTKYPVVSRWDLVREVFQIVDWNLVTAEQTGFEQDSIVMHILRGTVRNGKFVPTNAPDYSVWVGSFIKSQLENMTPENAQDELFSCRPGTYDRKSKKARQLDNSEIDRYYRLSHTEREAYAIWLDFYDNFDDDILSQESSLDEDEDEEEEIEEEEIEEEEPEDLTPAARNRKMVANGSNSRAYEQEKKPVTTAKAVNPSRARIKTIGKRAKFDLNTELDIIGYMPRGTEEFNQETGQFVHKDGRLYDVDLRKWVAAK